MSLDDDIARAVRRHPAGSDDLARPGFGVRRVEVRPAQEIAVRSEPGDGNGVVVGWATIPPIHMLECLGCGALLVIGSPLVTKHHLQHRAEANRPTRRLARQARKMIARSRAHARRLLTRQEG